MLWSEFVPLSARAATPVLLVRLHLRRWTGNDVGPSRSTGGSKPAEDCLPRVWRQPAGSGKAWEHAGGAGWETRWSSLTRKAGRKPTAENAAGITGAPFTLGAPIHKDNVWADANDAFPVNHVV